MKKFIILANVLALLSVGIMANSCHQTTTQSEPQKSDDQKAPATGQDGQKPAQ